jgi:hypothetical protein
LPLAMVVLPTLSLLGTTKEMVTITTTITSRLPLATLRKSSGKVPRYSVVRSSVATLQPHLDNISCVNTLLLAMSRVILPLFYKSDGTGEFTSNVLRPI